MEGRGLPNCAGPSGITEGLLPRRCLGCRACEQVCPAGVEYGQLLEAARGELFTDGPPRGFSYGVLRLLLKHVWLYPGRL